MNKKGAQERLVWKPDQVKIIRKEKETKVKKIVVRVNKWKV